MIRPLINRLPLTFRDKFRDVWRAVKIEVLIVSGKCTRLFYRPPLPNNLDGSINIHLGCGSIDHPAFINIDGIPAPHIHYVSRIDKLSQFRNDSVDLIYACHCLEHFSHRELQKVLSEWFRVIKPNGILRLSVPDFDILVNIYEDNLKDINTVIYPLLGSHINKFDIHKSVFTEKNLGELLIRTGFKMVHRWFPGSDTLTTFEDWSSKEVIINGKTYNLSLNIEAIK